jgi:membrane-associated protein
MKVVVVRSLGQLAGINENMLSEFVEVFLHLDKHLADLVQVWGAWIYAVLFIVIFVETGLIIMPFLPGDSLLFVAGAIAAVGGMSLETLVITLTLAAILGDALNYSIGRAIGSRVFSWESSRFFNKESFDKTYLFFERYGPITIVVGRFLPLIRTFAPFVAGVVSMQYRRFLIYNVFGAVLWVAGLTTLGYLLGNQVWVKENFSAVALAMIVVPGIAALWLVFRKRHQSRGI